MAKSYDKDGGSGGSGLQDIYLRHGINLTRYSTYEARKLQGILDEANKQIKSLIAKAKGIETKKKYHRISAEIKRISAELNKKLIGQVELDFTELAQTETEFIEKAMRTIGITVDFELPAPAKVWATASFGNYAADGRETFETYLNGLSDNLYKAWDTSVRAGYLTGQTAQQINRNVLGSIKDMDPGQMQGLRQSLERNTRTMITSLCETARNETYK
jgi:cob(I)alamin adenosyltransferase